MIHLQQPVNKVVIKVGTLNDVAKLSEAGPQRLDEPGPEAGIPGDMILLAFAEETPLAAAVVNVAREPKMLTEQLGFPVALPAERFRALTVRNTRFLKDGAAFAALLLVILEMAVESQFADGTRIMCKIGIGPIPKLTSRLFQRLESGTFGGHRNAEDMFLTELDRPDMYRAINKLRHDQIRRLIPIVENQFPLSIFLPGTVVPPKHGFRDISLTQQH